MSGGGKGGGDQTVGYKYFFGLLMGLGRGPLDSLAEIRVGDRAAWRGSVTKSARIQIEAASLFGGERSEGGVQGPLDVMMGEADQSVNPGVLAMLGSYVPAFRGVATLFFNGMVGAMNPYPKTWKMRVRRVTKGWSNGQCWYPEKAVIMLIDPATKAANDATAAQIAAAQAAAAAVSAGKTTGDTGSDPTFSSAIQASASLAEANMVGDQSAPIDPPDPAIWAMNPAHILVQCATDQDWGRGLDYARLDQDSYRRAADQLFDEGFGLCLPWKRQDTLSSFVQTILNHIGAAQYIDRQTGLLTLHLIRDDYDVNQLPVYDYMTGLLGIDDDDTGAQDTAANEILVKWHNPVTNEDCQVRWQNLAAIRANGKISTTTEYPGLPTADLAARIAQRDGRAITSGVKRFKIRLDRRASPLAPAAVFRVNDPFRGIANMVLRVGELSYGTAIDGTITVTAIQDVFGMPATTYIAAATGGWMPPDASAQPAPNAVLMELPYLELQRRLSAADLAQVAPDTCGLMVLAQRPTGLSLNFDILSGASGESLAVHGSGDWTPTGVTVADVDPLATTIAIGAGINLNLVQTPCAALIGNELVRVDAMDDSGQLTLGRGCVDTIPAVHPVGSRIWFYQSHCGIDQHEYVAGETVAALVLTRTATATLAPTLAPALSLAMQQRQFRPYPPGNVLINGQSIFGLATAAGPLTLSWAGRNRLTQADQLIDHTAGPVAPETGTSYRITVATSAGVPLVQLADITGTVSLPLITDDQGQPIGPQTLLVSLTASRGGLDALQTYCATINWQPIQD